MDIKYVAVELGATEFLGIYAFTEEELKAFYRAVVDECIETIEPTQYHHAYPQNFLGEFEGLELLELRVDMLTKLKGEQNAIVS